MTAKCDVFHGAGCKAAAKIAEKNLVRYASREEAANRQAHIARSEPYEGRKTPAIGCGNLVTACRQGDRALDAGLAAKKADTPGMNLTYFDRARVALAKSIDLNELKSIRDKASALRNYAGRATEMARQCAEIRLRAERRLGELLAKAIRPGNPQLSQRATIGLDKLGITRDQSSRWQAAATLPAADFEKYLSTTREPTTTGVLKLVENRRRASKGGPSRGGNILTGPARQLFDRLTDDSVDLFLTDPPYAEMDLYDQLAELAAVKLKPGGLCLAYCGQTHLPRVLEAMGVHLQYHWTFAIRFRGPHRAVYAKRIANTWHPVVAFSKGKATAPWIMDMLTSGGKEKDAHDHQKTLSDIEYMVEKLTAPGDLVVDPFLGMAAME